MLIIRDPNSLDAGTVFKPDKGQLYVDRKVPTRVTSIPRGELQDVFGRPAGPVEPRQAPPARPAPAPIDRLPARIGGGPVPPESVPHPVHPPHSHHGPPVIGRDELPDLDEFTPAP